LPRGRERDPEVEARLVERGLHLERLAEELLGLVRLPLLQGELPERVERLGLDGRVLGRELDELPLPLVDLAEREREDGRAVVARVGVARGALEGPRAAREGEPRG